MDIYHSIIGYPYFPVNMDIPHKCILHGDPKILSQVIYQNMGLILRGKKPKFRFLNPFLKPINKIEEYYY